MKPTVTASFAIVLSFLISTTSADAKPLNFVHIIIDDLRTEGLKSYGDETMVTPSIDRLASEGVVFDRAYANFPSCGASRASLLTGLRPSQQRFTRYDARIDTDAPGVITLPGYLKQNGYQTVSLGKVIHARGDTQDAWSVEPWDAKYAPGNQTSYFDYSKSENIDAFLNSCKERGICSPSGDGKGPVYESADVPDETYIDGKTAVAAIAALEELKEADVPFYLAIGFVKPHLPFTAPQKYWDLYDRDKISMSPAATQPENAPNQAWHPSGELRDWYDGIPDIPPRWLDNVPAETARILRQGYFAATSYSDAQAGKVLDALERLNLADNTVVILSGDHGYSLGDHTLWNKHSLFTLATQSPLIIRKPGGLAGKNVSGVVEYVDIYPTVVELAGLPMPPHLQGESLVPSLNNVNAQTKPAIFTRYQAGENIHTDRYSYSAWFEDDEITGHMLYDHETDPLETVNVADHPEYKSVVNDLQETLEAHIAEREAQAQNDTASAEDRPNILLIMAEDMSDRVGAFGDPVAVTPNIDRLASKGVLYPNTFTTAGVCSPSRAAHILSRHQISVGAQHMRTSFFEESPYRTVPPNHIKAYPELLRREGYYTFTSWKLDYQFSSVIAGSGPFSLWDYEGESPTWDGREEGQPFFGFISLMESHEGQMFPDAVLKNNASGTRSQPVSPDQVVVPPYYPDTPVIRADIAQHYNNIQYMDQLLGDLLEKLEADGLADSTIIIWTADHGDGLPRAKREVYDSGIKVPLIVYWPERFRPEHLAESQVDDRLVSFIDIAPSILQIAGIEIPDYMQGTAQLTLQPAPEQEYIYASKDRLDEFTFRERAVRNQQYKYILNLMPGQPGAQHIAYRDQLPMMMELWQHYEAGRLNAAQRFWFEPRPEQELYDIVADPYEINNLAEKPEYSETLEQMHEALETWRSTMPDYSDRPELEMAREFWPDGVQPVTSSPKVEISSEGQITILPVNPDDSIGYRIDKGRWKIYSGPFTSPAGSQIQTKAVRYGWAESPVVSADL